MIYFKQEKDYTCGCACFRMILSHFNMEVPSEHNLEKEMNTSFSNTGTDYSDMKKIGEKYGLIVKDGINGNLNELDKLINDRWIIVLGISLDVPHFVIYLENNGNHIFLNDPFRGERSNFLLKKFLKYHWDINDKKYQNLKKHFPDLNFDPIYNRHKYWIAYKYENK